MTGSGVRFDRPRVPPAVESDPTAVPNAVQNPYVTFTPYRIPL
jgi:hypothetical protein